MLQAGPRGRPVWRHPVGPYLPRLGSCRERAGNADGRVRSAAKWETEDDCCSSRRDRSGAEPPGWRGRARPIRQPAARTSFALGDAPSRRESTLTVAALVGCPGVDTHKGRFRLGGGPGGALRVTFCPSGRQNPRREALRLSAAPAPSRGRTTVAPSHSA
jgi:hypothetical protein